MDNIAASPVSTEVPETAAAPIQNAPVVAQEPDAAILSVYEQSKGMPYTAAYFSLSKNQFETLKSADIDDTTFKMSQIDNYVRDKIANERYIDSTKTFDRILGEIKQALGIKDYEQTAAQIDKIFSYITEGRPYIRQYQVKRSSIADQIDHTKNRVISDLKGKFPNKFNRLGSFNNFFNK